MIVIGKSAPVDRPAYCLNLLKCHCYPPGLPMQLTYRKSYIDQRLLDDGEENLKGRTVLILFCDQPPDEKEFNYIPLRFATFRRFAPNGPEAAVDDSPPSVPQLLFGAY